MNVTIPAAKRRLRRYLFRMLGRFTPVVAVDGPSGRLLLYTDDQVIGCSAFSSGEFEEAKIATTIEILSAEGYRLQDTTFLDVGANTGISTVPALRRFGFASSVAVEPSPANCALLFATLAVNGLSDRTRVVQAAASDCNGFVTLELSPTNSGDHRVRVGAGGGIFEEERRMVVQVPSVRLSEVDVAGLPRVGLIWADTQGHEGHVLSGLGDAMRDVPACFEFWPYGLRRSGGMELLYDSVADRFSRIMDCRTRRWLPADSISTLEVLYRGKDQTDLIALPK